MKAKDLIKILQDFPEFEVVASYTHRDNSEWGLAIDSYKITELGDIGYSDKIIILDMEEED